jgi:hypothetical protein
VVLEKEDMVCPAFSLHYTSCTLVTYFLKHNFLTKLTSFLLIFRSNTNPQPALCA